EAYQWVAGRGTMVAPDAAGCESAAAAYPERRGDVMANDFGNGEPRPWELPGAVRRDCAPHRAGLLKMLAAISVVCGLLSFCLVVPSVIGLPCGLLTLILAERDQREMRAGRMDPRGSKETADAGSLGLFGVVCSLVCPLMWAGFLVRLFR